MEDNSQPEMPEFEPDEIIATEVVEHQPPQTDRSAARRGALQVLYELDTTDHKVGDVINLQLEHNPLPKRASRYLNSLVTQVLGRRGELDEIIQRYASEFPLNQVAVIDRNILRLALIEFAVLNSVPLKVAIDEAMQLARLFGADGSLRFINGVLGALANDDEIIREMLNEQDET